MNRSHVWRRIPLVLGVIGALVLSGCGATVSPLVPTARPTQSPTPEPTATRTPDRDATPTYTPTRAVIASTGGPSPTPLFGAAVVLAVSPTSAPPVNPNAPRVEFFTSNAAAVAPGSSVTLFWSTRNVSTAVIYQIANGIRSNLWNVSPDGNLPVSTRRSDRGSLEFVLSVGDGLQRVEQTLSIPLACPDVWFFNPSPTDCPTGVAEETFIIEQPFERGRMIYLQNLNRIYALFNDTFDPAWLVIDNRYDPAIHPESAAEFPVPPGAYQPIRELGFVWRGNDLSRNRLGLGIQPEAGFNGSIQFATNPDGRQTLYVSSVDGVVLRLLPGGAAWEIITPPS